MDIYLLRHAIAAPLGEDNHFVDAERALTPEGTMKMRKASLGLKKLGVTFDLVASSPLVRARKTAEIVVEVFKSKQPVELWDQLGPGESIDALFKRLEEYQDKGSVLLVGHQPDLGYLASQLIFGSNPIPLTFKKGGVCCIQVSEIPLQSPGELVWMMPPKILRMLGGK